MNIESSKSTWMEIGIAAILLFSIGYLLLPIGWEPGGEDWKKWLAARMLLNGQWPVVHMSLLYWTYAAGLMQIFDYPVFVKVEYALTHTFFMTAMYYCLRGWLAPWKAIFVTIAFFPAVQMIEGGSVLIASGFVFIYLSAVFTAGKVHLLPLTLVAAAASHSAFSFMLVGHVVGYLAEGYFSQSMISQSLKNWREKLRLSIAIMFLAVICFAWLNPAPLPFNNAYMDDLQWAPIPSTPKTSGLALAVFAIAPHYYLMRRFSDTELIEKDWYFTSNELFGGAQSLSEAIVRSPHIFAENAYHSIRAVPTAINTFLFQWNVFPVKLIALVTSAYSLCIVILWLFNSRKYAALGAIVVCMTAVGGALLLTWIGNPRYDIVLFPLLLSFVFFTAHRQGALLPWLHAKDITGMLIVAGAILATLAAPPRNPSEGDRLLERKDGYIQSYTKLRGLIRPNEVILANESVWLRGFFGLHPKQIISGQKLPPFSDTQGVATLLADVTQIWVTPSMSTVGSSIGSQSYLRYRLHIEPFLKSANWDVFDLGDFGKIYRRPMPGDNTSNADGRGIK